MQDPASIYTLIDDGMQCNDHRWGLLTLVTVMCPFKSKSLWLLLSTGSTQEDRKSSQHDWKMLTGMQIIDTKSLKTICKSFRNIYTASL